MKVLAQQINTNYNLAKAFELGKLITITGSAQVAVQALGFASGILIIRLLPTAEYALYTLANTMVGTMVLLADGGIAMGVLAEGGKVWQSPQKLGSVLSTGLNLRRKFAVVSLLLATPVLLYLLRHHQASWLTAILLTISLIPTFITTLSGTILEIAPKLQQRIVPLQRIQVSASLSRLLLLALSLFVFPWAYVAVLAAGLPQIWANRRLHRISSESADHSQSPDPVVQQQILAKVKRLLPDAIFYCISCQFAIWLVSFFGSTAAVAQLGGLGRLAVALNVFTVLFASLVMPRFARLPHQAGGLLRRFLQIEAGLALLLAGVVVGIWLFATPILWILGNSYTGLQQELVLMILGKCLSFMAATAFMLSTSKGWVINPLVSIPITIAAMAGGVALFDVSSLRGIFLMDIFVATVQLLMNATYFLVKNNRLALSSSPITQGA